MADKDGNILTNAVSAVPSLVSGAAQFVGNLFNNKSNEKENARQRDFAWDMYGAQQEDARWNWHMANAYNDPSAQMARLKNAGLNPNLVYGNGADAQSKGQPQTPSGSSYRGTPERWDIGSIAQTALMTQQMMANIAKTKAETKALDATTSNTEFENAIKQEIPINEYVVRLRSLQTSDNYKTRKEVMEFEAWQQAGFNGKHQADKNSPITIALRSGFEKATQELEIAKSNKNIAASEEIIQRFKSNLAKNGISPDSPWYAKILFTLAERIGITDLINIPADAVGGYVKENVKQSMNDITK